jgi:hypothetical protein
MPARVLLCLSLGLAVALVVGCGAGGPKPPDRDTVLGLLRQEAESMKKEGEKMDPSFGVAATWHIDAVEVAERPGDKEKPWNGTVRFTIESRTREPDGSATVDKIPKTFDYTYDLASKRWMVRY